MRTITKFDIVGTLTEAVQPYRTQRNNHWRKIIEGGWFQQIYPHFLIHTYHYVKYSCKLMEASLDQLASHPSGIQNYIKKHIQDEMGEEQWLLDDLSRLGINPSTVKKSLPIRCVAGMVGTQKFLQDENSSIGILGYIWTLETDPPQDETLQHLVDNCGIPKEALYTLVEHGDKDIEHSKEIIDILSTLSLSEREIEIVKYSAQVTAAYTCEIPLALEGLIPETTKTTKIYV